MFANVKQRLKMRPHKLWRMALTDLLSGTGTDSIFFLVFISATGQLIMKPLSLLYYSTLVLGGLLGNKGGIENFT